MKQLPEGFIRDDRGRIIDARTPAMVPHGFDDFVRLVEALRRVDSNNLNLIANGKVIGADDSEIEYLKGHAAALDTVLAWAKNVEYISIDEFGEDER